MIAAVMFSLLAVALGQAPPYWGGSDFGVLPMYLPQNQNTDSDNRLGAASASGSAAETTTKANKPLHAGTLETEDVYNRVAEWPDDRKPFWYLNAVAIQKQVSYFLAFFCVYFLLSVQLFYL